LQHGYGRKYMDKNSGNNPQNYEGYFDTELREMREHLNNSAMLPTFNQEFGTSTDKPYMITAGTTTFRGHVGFRFIGPLPRQVNDLATFYHNKGPTKGGSDSLVEQMYDPILAARIMMLTL
jgi:hypothetical protein